MNTDVWLIGSRSRKKLRYAGAKLALGSVMATPFDSETIASLASQIDRELAELQQESLMAVPRSLSEYYIVGSLKQKVVPNEIFGGTDRTLWHRGRQ